MRIQKRYYKILPRREQQETIQRRLKVSVEEITPPCTLFLDQASSTGFCLYDSESRIVLSGVANRGRMSLYEYKTQLVEFILGLVTYYEIETIFYEEVYDDLNMVTTETLFYLKHAIKDLGYQQKGIEVLGLAHKTWKTKLAEPGKFKFGKDDKQEIRKWVSDIYPLLSLTKQDEYDAIGMGIAMMIKEKGKKNFYQFAKYNKRLPIHTVLYPKVFEDLDTISEDRQEDVIQERVNKMRVAFRRGYAVSGLHELELDRRKEIYDPIRRFLSHVDGLVYINIPKEYKYWGMLLLLHDDKPENYRVEGSDGGFYMLAARKNRL